MRMKRRIVKKNQDMLNAWIDGKKVVAIKQQELLRTISLIGLVKINIDDIPYQEVKDYQLAIFESPEYIFFEKNQFFKLDVTEYLGGQIYSLPYNREEWVLCDTKSQTYQQRSHSSYKGILGDQLIDEITISSTKDTK